MKDGILILDKPQNWTSSDCVAICRSALRVKGKKKVGHGGTLDPMATGVLPIFVGQATRIMEYLDLDDKIYRCTAQLGTVTDTLDIWGETLETRDFQGITEADIRKGLETFEGWIQQIPPKYSAVRIDGKRLYEYAYKGQEIDIDIKPRTVNVRNIDVLSVAPDSGTFVFDVTCSKGTYVRTICSDLGEMLGCGCVMTALERTEVGNISLDGSPAVLRPQEIKERRADSYAAELERQLLPVDYPLVHFGTLQLSEEGTVSFSRGNAIAWRKTQVLQEPDAEYMRTRRQDGSIPLNARGRRYDRIYKVYQRETGEFLGTGYYDIESNLLKADKVFIDKR